MVVRFADDDEDEASNVAITVEDGRPSDGTARRGSSAHRRVASLDEDAAQTPTEPDDGPLHLGGLQMLRDDMQDYGYGHSGAESEGDGPLDAGMPRSLGTVSAGDGPLLDGTQQHHASVVGGVEGPVLLGPGGERVPVGAVPSGRRHHRALSGRPGKGGNKQSKSAVMRTWLRIDKNGETSILQVGGWEGGGRGGGMAFGGAGRSGGGGSLAHWTCKQGRTGSLTEAAVARPFGLQMGAGGVLADGGRRVGQAFEAVAGRGPRGKRYCKGAGRGGLASRQQGAVLLRPEGDDEKPERQLHVLFCNSWFSYGLGTGARGGA